MPAHKIPVILFDLGQTLIYSRHPWGPVFQRADQALLDSLADSGLHFYPPISTGEFQTHLNRYYDQRNLDHRELTAFSVLTDFLMSRGYTNLPAEVLRSALDAMYAITEENWFIEADTHSVLDILHEAGFHLGLISNAADDKNVQNMIDHWDLRRHFEFILTSAACGMRKPHPYMFQAALEYFAVPPDRTAMLGDTLLADIAGANSLGIYTIWITRHAQTPPDGILAVQPDAVISSLEQLPALLVDIDQQDE